jgi:hypothetical protein
MRVKAVRQVYRFLRDGLSRIYNYITAWRKCPMNNFHGYYDKEVQINKEDYPLAIAALRA